MRDTVLITGASGFTGPYMAKALKTHNYKLIGASFRGQEIDSVFDESVQLDLCDEDATRDVIESIDPNYIVHLAGISFVGHKDLNVFYSTNVVGAENLLNAANSLPNLKNVLIASSANVYGVPQTNMCVDESVLPSPVNHYAISKLALEFVAKKFMSSIPITIARPFNYIGYGQSGSFLIPKIVRAFANSQAELEMGSVDIYRDFTDVRDTVGAYDAILHEPKCIGEVFNVCSGRATKISSILDLMEQVSGLSMRVVSKQEFIRRHEIKHLLGSNRKVKEYTGWMPERSLEQTLRSMYDKYREDADN